MYRKVPGAPESASAPNSAGRTEKCLKHRKVPMLPRN